MTPALFDPARHEPLADIAWEEGVARGAIEAICQEARAAFTPGGLWPLHPRDGGGDGKIPAQTSLYFGAAGMVWGLDHLARLGFAAGADFARHLPAIQAANAAGLAGPYWRESLGEAWQDRSYLLGAAGILLARLRAGDEAAPGALEAVIGANSDDPALELMWGAPGTMLIALHLYRETGQARWADLFRAGARALLSHLDADGLWTQFLYGRPRRLLGAVHGFAGNAYVLNAGRDLLEAGVWAGLAARLARTVEDTAARGGQGANWGSAMEADSKLMVQVCHGAPGMIIALAQIDAVDEDLLLAGGELTWAAGPLAKGANLCHGTAGNGHAFLKLFERTGDGLWLDRARAFAMHAIQQSRAEAAQLGMGRYSLWTGDIGVACHLAECIAGTARFPTLDVL